MQEEYILWEKTQAILTQYLSGQKPDVWRKIQDFQKNETILFLLCTFPNVAFVYAAVKW